MPLVYFFSQYLSYNGECENAQGEGANAPLNETLQRGLVWLTVGGGLWVPMQARTSKGRPSDSKMDKQIDFIYLMNGTRLFWNVIMTCVVYP